MNVTIKSSLEDYTPYTLEIKIEGGAFIYNIFYERHGSESKLLSFNSFTFCLNSLTSIETKWSQDGHPSIVLHLNSREKYCAQILPETSSIEDEIKSELLRDNIYRALQNLLKQKRLEINPPDLDIKVEVPGENIPSKPTDVLGSSKDPLNTQDITRSIKETEDGFNAFLDKLS